MAASIEAITDAEVTMVRNGGDWAIFMLRAWDRPDPLDRQRGGSLVVHSSFGAFSYIWGNTGCPFKQFVKEHLANDWHYTMKNFLNGELKEFSLEHTKQAMRVRILLKRREDGLHADREYAKYLERARNLRHSLIGESEHRRYKQYLTRDKAFELWEQIEKDSCREEILDTLMSDTGVAAFGFEGYDYLRSETKEWVGHFFNRLFVPFAENLSLEKRKK